MKYNQPKYNITDTSLKEHLYILLESFGKIESYFNSKLFKNAPTSARDLNTFESLNNNSFPHMVAQENEPDSNNDSSINISQEVINMDSYRSAQLSDFVNNLNIGVLIPLNCGHNGTYSSSEMEMLGFYLLNSKFI
jgi:hypothetical protein